MKMLHKKVYLVPVIVGIALVLVGLFMRVPGGALTTYEGLDGKHTELYAFDNKYSSIDEYVGGDAYNYIIGATLVAGKMVGTMISKTILIVSGIMCMLFGFVMYVFAGYAKHSVIAAAITQSNDAPEKQNMNEIRNEYDSYTELKNSQ